MAAKPVFFDPTGRRARRVSFVTWTLAVVSTVLLIAFVASVLIVPVLPGVDFRRIHPVAVRTDAHKSVVPALLRRANQLAAEARAKERGIPRAQRAKTMAITPARRPPPALLPANRTKPLTIGFYVNWDDSSYASLRRSLQSLDWIVPAWLTLGGDDMALSTDVDRKALDLVHRLKPDMPILPLLQNSQNDVWEGAGLAKFLADKDARAKRIQQIVQFVEQYKLQGVTVDFEEVPPEAQPNLQAFIAELNAAFDPHKWVVALAVPFDDDNWNYEAYAEHADYLVLMAYDQHWATGRAGSIAGQSWFEEKLDKRMAQLDPDRTILALGNYGYDWVKGQEATDLTFQESVLAARDSEAEISFDDETLNPHFSFVEDDGKAHDVWMLDGITTFNEIHAADPYKPAGYALWRLGSEDPSVWSVLGKPYDAGAPAALRTLAMGEDIDFEGTGEILHILAEPGAGARTFELEKDTGDIVDEAYTNLPTSFVIQRLGAAKGKVALTFDDGPDPVWTPQILDILKAKKVPATFFIIGSNAQANPDLVQREIDEGHEVGNHTFTHPNLGEAPSGIVQLEINATQRLFEALTGRSMRLFRPPYFGDAEPTTQDEVVPVEIAQQMGYVTVGLRVDPDDWQQPSASDIISRTLAQVTNPNPEERGQIVLLHDAGGDRSQTVAALPALIDTLRAKGFSIVPVSELAGLSRDQAMPPLPPGAFEVVAARPIFLFLGWLGHTLHWLVLATIGLGFARLIFLCGLALRNAYIESRRRVPAFEIQPLVSVLIPAFNEANVIGFSIDRILASSYPNLEVIVIDDGSTDTTSEIVRQRCGDNSRVTLITIANSGKATAVNTGLARARGEIVVALDADTQFEPETISRLTRWFADPKVGAVAGNAKVGNRVNMMTRWQALEYITAQNLERRALAAINCVTVVPGAVGAWRRRVLDDLGGFPADTLAEDQDLTISVQRAGWQVMFDAEAIAWTEAPDTLKGLARQRFRWAYGTLQCLWKHSGAVLRPRYGTLGLVGLPQVWLFQILFAVISPLVDLMLVWQLIGTYIDYLQHGALFSPNNLIETGAYYAIFMLVDIGAALIAFALERGEDRKLLWWLTLQRFGYRQIMYYVVLKSLGTAMTGPFVGWGKLSRKATVKAA
ncbi:MAG: glycosyltransferase [Alphaproteobacteria bacterium]|nr:glycosyltransferase [Alphaproteobacteria bacterium]